MNDSTEAKSRARTVSRAKLLGLMGLYAAPLLLAWAWFAYVSMNEGAGVSVNGELIHPAVPLQSFALNSMQTGTIASGVQSSEEQSTGEPIEWGLNDIRGKWSMVYFSGSTCGEPCETTLYNMRQIRLSTGRRMERVQRVLVTPEWLDMQKRLESASEGLQVVGGDIDGLHNQFVNAQTDMDACPDCIYLVDPYGNLMMRFPSDLPPAKILKDLKHLLKTSRIG